MNIAFCINSLGMSGLGATLASLVHNCQSPKSLKLWFLCNGLSSIEKKQIENLLLQKELEGRFWFIDFDPLDDFGELKSLHGDWTTYGRLLLPELINEDFILYLDSDLLIEVDLVDLKNYSFGGHALGAVNGGTIGFSLENQFYVNKINIHPETPCFNAGVIYFDLKKWREENLKQKCLEFASRYPMDLLSCDQTILNAVFAGEFSELPNTYNCAWYPNDIYKKEVDNCIIHFVGSPKPWDMFGNILHSGYSRWKSYNPTNWLSSYYQFDHINLKRTWSLRRSYTRLLLNKLKPV